MLLKPCNARDWPHSQEPTGPKCQECNIAIKNFKGTSLSEISGTNGLYQEACCFKSFLII